MERILPQLVDSLLPVLGSLLALLGAWLANEIRRRVQSEHARGVMLRLVEATDAAVREVEQTVVPEVRAAAADGKITGEEAAKIRDAAVNRAKMYLGRRGIGELQRVIDTDQLEAVIRGRVEAAVHGMKSEKPQ